MLGLMQNHPLLISSLIEHTSAYHPEAEIVSRTVEGPIHRCTYRDIRRRSKQLAKALTARGVRVGDCIGTLAWNIKPLSSRLVLAASCKRLHSTMLTPRFSLPAFNNFWQLHAGGRLR